MQNEAQLLGTQLVGTTIDDKFVIRRHLGSGAMAAVYEAEQLGLGRIVAVKFSNATYDQELLSRFKREADAISRLEHPNVVRFFLYGVWRDQYPYIAMEHLSGRSLKALLDEKHRLPWRQACQIARGVLSGLSAVHQASLVHRDLSPNNIMLCNEPGALEPTPKIIDLGLASLQDKSLVENKLTATGALVGTLHYLSPEAASGNKIDARADIYALGCTLYESITGKLAVDAATPLEIIQQLRTVYPAPISETDAPPFVNYVVFKALSKDPDQRYQTAADMAADIERALAGETSAPSFATPPKSHSSPDTKSGAPKLLLSAALCAGIALAIGMAITATRSPNAAAPNREHNEVKIRFPAIAFEETPEAKVVTEADLRRNVALHEQQLSAVPVSSRKPDTPYWAGLLPQYHRLRGSAYLKKLTKQAIAQANRLSGAPEDGDYTDENGGAATNESSTDEKLSVSAKRDLAKLCFLQAVLDGPANERLSSINRHLQLVGAAHLPTNNQSVLSARLAQIYLLGASGHQANCIGKSENLFSAATGDTWARIFKGAATAFVDGQFDSTYGRHFLVILCGELKRMPAGVSVSNEQEVWRDLFDRLAYKGANYDKHLVRTIIDLAQKKLALNLDLKTDYGDAPGAK